MRPDEQMPPDFWRKRGLPILAVFFALVVAWIAFLEFLPQHEMDDETYQRLFPSPLHPCKTPGWTSDPCPAWMNWDAERGRHKP